MRLQMPTPAYSPYRVMLPPVRDYELAGLRGLGDVTSGQITAASNSASQLAATLSSNEPPSLMALNSAASALATAAALTPPPASVILLAASGVAKILATLGIGEGCGVTCTQATAIVNQAEPAFVANVMQYEAGQITQQQAIDTYNNLWSAMAVACHAIPGTAGQDCLSDRQQGACTWKQTADGDTLGLPGVPDVGECWNWYLGYYVPLTYPPVNAPAGSVGAQAASSTSATSSSSSVIAGLSSSTLLLVGAGVLALFAFGGSN
jgi:hypothetical protein